MATDADGNAYVVGYTPGTFAGQTGAGANDAFLAKVSSVGSPLWTRQFGTTMADVAKGVAVDGAGNAYAVGYTKGTFAGQTNAGSFDVFVSKFDAAGEAAWTHMFGTILDESSGAATFGAGRVFFAGSTSGVTPGQQNAGKSDVMVLSVAP